MGRLLKEDPVSLLFREGDQKWPWGEQQKQSAGKAAAIRPWWGLWPAESERLQDREMMYLFPVWRTD